MTREHVKDKLAVWNGEKKKTSSGLKRSDLMKNKDGKIVSKKQHKRGQQLYKMMKKEGRLAEPFQKKSKSKSKSQSRPKARKAKKSKSKSASKGKKGKGRKAKKGSQ